MPVASVRECGLPLHTAFGLSKQIRCLLVAFEHSLDSKLTTPDQHMIRLNTHLGLDRNKQIKNSTELGARRDESSVGEWIL